MGKIYKHIYNPQLDSLGGAESNYRLRTKRGKTSPGTRDLGPVPAERGELSSLANIFPSKTSVSDPYSMNPDQN
jgi:hypothetical protein